MRRNKDTQRQWLAPLIIVCGLAWVIMAGAAPVEGAAPGNWFQAWLSGIWQQIDFNLIQGNRYTMLLDGLGVTLKVSFVAALIGFSLGLVLALMRLSELHIGGWYPLRWISSLYVDVIRGTPVVVQLFIMYYIVLISFTNKEIVAFLTFGLNSAAYVSEIFRGGILAVDKGQTEAGRSLGLGSADTLYLIVMPQMIKITLPTLLNEYIALLKETAVLGMIGLMDLAKAGDFIRSRTYSPYVPLFTVALIYLLLITVLSNVFKRLEGRMRKSDLR